MQLRDKGVNEGPPLVQDASQDHGLVVDVVQYGLLHFCYPSLASNRLVMSFRVSVGTIHDQMGTPCAASSPKSRASSGETNVLLWICRASCFVDMAGADRHGKGVDAGFLDKGLGVLRIGVLDFGHTALDHLARLPDRTKLTLDGDVDHVSP